MVEFIDVLYHLSDLNIDNLLLGSSGQLLLTFFYRKHRNYDDFMCNLNLGALHDLYVAPEVN